MDSIDAEVIFNQWLHRFEKDVFETIDDFNAFRYERSIRDRDNESRHYTLSRGMIEHLNDVRYRVEGGCQRTDVLRFRRLRNSGKLLCAWQLDNTHYILKGPAHDRSGYL